MASKIYRDAILLKAIKQLQSISQHAVDLSIKKGQYDILANAVLDVTTRALKDSTSGEEYLNRLKKYDLILDNAQY